jgi:uncharacterized protein (TIGR00255 family)
MAFSMTGLGIGENQCDGTSITVELRSVNNRFLEVSCRMPSFLAAYEREVRDIIRQHVHRGKIYVQVSVQGDNDTTLGIHVNTKQTKSVRNLLSELCHHAGIDENLKLEHFLQFSEIFESPKELDNSKQIWEGVKRALHEALSNLNQMRAAEGNTLVSDLHKRIHYLNTSLLQIEDLTMKNIKDMYVKLLGKIQKLVSDAEINEDRLYAEIALLVDKSDITEECVRLHSHNDLFSKMIQEETVIGKKLIFLLQEMNREVNTIASKATHSEVSHIVVSMKEEIEKLREQSQNLE